MRVCARQTNHANAPAPVRPYLGQALVTVGTDYEVHAAAVFEGVVLVQVVDDLGYPGWKPAWLFDVVDSAIPADWICSTYHGEPALVLGLEFVAGSVGNYASMVELEAAQVDRFWKRVENLRRQE